MDLGRSWTKIPNSLDCYNLRLPSIIVMTALHNDLHTIGFAAWWCRNCYETQFSLVWLMNRATNNGVLCFVCSLVFSQAVNREYGMVTSHFGTRTLRYQDISVPLTWSRSVRTVRVWSRSVLRHFGTIPELSDSKLCRSFQLLCAAFYWSSLKPGPAH